MCASSIDLGTGQSQLEHPTLIPDDIARESSEKRDPLPPNDQGLNSSVEVGNGQRKRKVREISSVCDPSRTASTSKPPTPSSELHSHTMSSKDHLSTLCKMMDTEEKNRSQMNDYRALQDLDPCFHKQAWRERVAQWCYDVLDYLEESRDVAAVAMNIIDRYVAVLNEESSLSKSVEIGEFDYEVISFTALFLAIRVSGQNKELEISELLELRSCTGALQVRHIVSAGNSMLQKLSWNHQLLTPSSFLRELIALLMNLNQKEQAGKAIAHESLSNLVEFASYLVEISVCDIFFSSLAPSKIAFGALALGMMSSSDSFPCGQLSNEFLSRFFECVNEQTSMNIECPQMNSIISRLLHVYNESQEAAAAQNAENETLQWERSADYGAYQTSLPHVIEDSVEEPHITTERSSSRSGSECLGTLNDGTLHDEKQCKKTRPVSPLPQSLR